MDLLGWLGTLVRVVETGSFSAVSRERDVSQAAVARQISQLERHFGVRLFHRTTRKLNLTEDGEILLGHARGLLDGIDAIEAALCQSGWCDWVFRLPPLAISHRELRSCSQATRG
jgi:DNA-binding transcriptional LysR family regulator